MKTLKNTIVGLQNSSTEKILINSITVIEKTYLTLASIALILTIANLIKTALL